MTLRPRISLKGRAILRSNTASRTLMRTILANEGKISKGDPITFRVCIQGHNRDINLVKTTTRSDVIPAKP